MNEWRSGIDKTALASIKECEKVTIVVAIVERTTVAILQSIVEEHTTQGSVIYTVEALTYQGLNRDHETCNHSTKQFVN